ncbi:MAG TPA: hypothetical protein VGA73_17605, partial [Candidatus Binatia bacterium]
MRLRRRFIRQIFSLPPLSAAVLLVAGCAAAIPPLTKAPESYRGPSAEAPVSHPRDDWTFELGDGEKAKYRPETLLKNYHVTFPLWVGKSWWYETASRRQTGYGPLTMDLRMHIECQVASFRPITVKAGTFDAFECRCACDVVGNAETYLCEVWTWWYAPAAKSIVRSNRET